ncbi:unnamed protein product [Polarella glacialis]|nr:unnamed protein product [Polarella glacialis]
MQKDILAARPDLQQFAFFLVLVNAGMEINIKHLKPQVLLLAVVPAVLEWLGISAYAFYFLGFAPIEALILGKVCMPLGEGLVIPRMMEFRVKHPEHPLPKLVLVWAPIEATVAMVLFGVLTGLSKGGASGSSLVARTLLLLASTVAAGILLGSLTGWALSNIKRLRLQGKQVFTGTPVEAFLVIVSVALAAFGTGVCLAEQASASWPSVLQPELFVIVTSSSFAHIVDPAVLIGVEEYIASIWVFGSIVLFSMLGSKTELSVFGIFFRVVPLMAVGLVLRFAGICMICWLMPSSWGKDGKYHLGFREALFLFLCTLPRATIQGALGSAPVLSDIFRRGAGGSGGTMLHFIGSTARLYIVCYAVVGSLLLEFFGPGLLKSTSRAAGISFKLSDGMPPAANEGGFALTGTQAQDELLNSEAFALSEAGQDAASDMQCFSEAEIQDSDQDVVHERARRFIYRHETT